MKMVKKYKKIKSIPYRNKMKIAIIGENYYPTVAGIQEHMYNQAKCLREEGHEACIITGMPEVDR